MCEIINVQKINNQFIVDCTPCKEDFTNAKLLQIINKHKQVYTTKEFKVEKTRGENGAAGPSPETPAGRGPPGISRLLIR